MSDDFKSGIYCGANGALAIMNIVYGAIHNSTFNIVLAIACGGVAYMNWRKARA
jgi:hypothetical protein